MKLIKKIVLIVLFLLSATLLSFNNKKTILTGGKTIIISRITPQKGSPKNIPPETSTKTPAKKTGETFFTAPSQEVKYTHIVNPYVKYSYEQMTSDSLKLALNYPGLISVGSIGKSVEGRDIIYIKIGKGQKEVLLCGSHHAREYISSTYLMKMTDEYAYRYAMNLDSDVFNIHDLLDKVSLYIVPMVNPDGVNLVQNGLSSVKNPSIVKSMVMLQSSYKSWKANINGVDLNRNYPALWDAKYCNTDEPSSEMFKGDRPASEPEVKALMKFTEEHDFLLAASFHTKGELIYWGDENTDQYIPEAYGIAVRLQKLTGYTINQISSDESVYGAGFENWFRQEFHKPGFCIELTPANGSTLPYPDKDFDKLVWNKAKSVGLFFIKESLNL